MMDPRGLGPVPVGGGWIIDESLFRVLLDFEIQKARRLRYSVSIVCLTLERSSAENGERSPASIAERIASHLRGTDAIALSSEGLLFFLLIDAETAHLLAILERLTTRFEAPMWSAGGASYPRTAIRAEDLLRQALDLLARARSEGGNRLYVAS
jgi:GGDEF domain-containing protein